MKTKTEPQVAYTPGSYDEARNAARGPFTIYRIGEDGEAEIALYRDPAQVVARCGSWEQARALVDALTESADLLATLREQSRILTIWRDSETGAPTYIDLVVALEIVNTAIANAEAR